MSTRGRIFLIVVGAASAFGLLVHDLYGTRLVPALVSRGLPAWLTDYFTVWLVAGAFAFVLVAALLSTKFPYLQKTPRFLVGLVGVVLALVPLGLVATYAVGVVPMERSGWLAMVIMLITVAVSLVPSRRGVVIASLAILAFAILAPVLIGQVPKHRKDRQQLANVFEREHDRLTQYAESWQPPDLSTLLEASQPDPNAIVRLDEMSPTISGADTTSARSAALWSMGSASRQLQSASGLEVHATDDGIWFPGAPANAILRNTEPMDIEATQVGAILIRMKVSAGRNFQLYWSDTDELKERSGTQVPLGTPGEWRTYEIKGAVITSSKGGGVEHIRRVYLIPSDHGADVEISQVDILDRISAAGLKGPADAGYEEIDGELRRVVALRSPLQAVYRVRIPLGMSHLEFGAALADAAQPVSLSVEVRRGDRFAPLLSTLVDSDRSWTDWRLDTSRWSGENVEIVVRTASDAPNAVYLSNPTLIGAAEDLPNVVMYLVDCLRADRLGCYGYAKNISPRLDALASQGVVFDHAYSNGCQTKHSIPSLFTSTPISGTGVWSAVDRLSDRFLTLPELLRRRGFATCAVAANRHVGPFSGTHQGFSYLFNSKGILREYDRDPSAAIHVNAEDIVGPVLTQWLDDHENRPFFLYIHTMDAHGPYGPPEAFRAPDLSAGNELAWDSLYDPPWLDHPTDHARRRLYDGEVAYGDQHLGRLVDMLRERGHWENTLFVFLADHGEYLGEYGMWGHHSPPMDEVTHIPLVMVSPRHLPSALRIDENVQILDVMPTVLDVVGLPSDHGAFHGETLVPLIEGKAGDTFRERAIYIESVKPGAPSLRYQRHCSIPERNLLVMTPASPSRLQISEYTFAFGLLGQSRRLSELYYQSHGPEAGFFGSGAEGTVGVDDETLEQLRALGYID